MDKKDIGRESLVCFDSGEIIDPGCLTSNLLYRAGSIYKEEVEKEI